MGEPCITPEQAEEIRKERGLTLEQFSVRLGYSPTAYVQAVGRGHFSWWMAREIVRRYGRRRNGK